MVNQGTSASVDEDDVEITTDLAANATDNFGKPTHGTELKFKKKSGQILAAEGWAAKNMSQELATALMHKPRRLITIRTGRSNVFTADTIVSRPVWRRLLLITPVQPKRSYRVAATLLHIRAPALFNGEHECSGCAHPDSKARGPFKDCVGGAGDFGGACTNVRY